MRVILAVVASAALATAASLGAQRPPLPPLPPAAPRTPATPRAPAPDSENCVTIGEGRTECTFVRRVGRDSALLKRGALGMQLSATGSIRDTLGVFVARVTPKGPAENAGIIEGDRIVSINGVDLRLSAADAGDSYTSGVPSHRLSREVAKLTPGSVANVRVYSGGRVRDIRVTAGRASDLMNSAFGYRLGGPGGNMGIYREIPGVGGNLSRPRFRMESRPRTRIEGAPRVRIESIPRIRMESAPRIRIEQLERDADLLINPDDDYLVGDETEIVIERTEKKEVKKGAAKKKTTK